MTRSYVSDTAKAIKESLKEHFPGTWFFVKSKTKGKIRIDVSWLEGPSIEEVCKVAKEVGKESAGGGLYTMRNDKDSLGSRYVQLYYVQE